MAVPTVTGHDLQSYTPGLRLLAGSFATNGSSNPAEASIKGVGFSVVRSGTGVYTVTLTAPVVDVVAMDISRTENAAGTFVVSATPYSASTRTFTITTAAPATPDTAANISAHANNRISFILMVKTIKGTR